MPSSCEERKAEPNPPECSSSIPTFSKSISLNRPLRVLQQKIDPYLRFFYLHVERALSLDLDILSGFFYKGTTNSCERKWTETTIFDFN
jgi:hypothetical protein